MSLLLEKVRDCYGERVHHCLSYGRHQFVMIEPRVEGQLSYV